MEITVLSSNSVLILRTACLSVIDYFNFFKPEYQNIPNAIEDSRHGFHIQVNFSTPYLIQLKEFFSNQMSNLSCSTLKIIVRSSVTQTCGRPDNITTL